MLNLRLFLLNHSLVYAWKSLPAELRATFSPNAILVQAECFIADPKRRMYRFELVEAAVGDAKPKRHRADVVIMQSWGLLTLVRYGAKPGAAIRCTSLRNDVIVSAEYVARRHSA